MRNVPSHSDKPDARDSRRLKLEREEKEAAQRKQEEEERKNEQRAALQKQGEDLAPDAATAAQIDAVTARYDSN